MKYELNPEESFYDNIIRVFRMKMDYEKIKFDYINPHMMQEIIVLIERYGNFEIDNDINDWVIDMFGA